MDGSPPKGTEVIWSIYKVSMTVPVNAPLLKLITFGKCTIESLEQLENA